MAPVKDPVEAVARVADARRDRLLRIHRRRLRWEDLEDCYSQATLELVARAKRDPFASSEHIQNALEQKFSSRIDDRRRAIGGRSPIETAIATALPVDAPEAGAGELEDPQAEVVRRVVGRIEVGRLREVADELTEDQRLVLACQISLDMDCAEFCRRFGWSSEKFRKVAQRGRSRLRALVAEYEVGERCARLEPDLIAFAARAATDEQGRRAAAHLANCTACSARLRALDRASRQVAALLPAPVLVRAGVLGKLGGAVLALRRVLGLPGGGGGAEAGAAGVAGGSAVGAGVLKLGVAAACLAGAAGGYAICAGTPRPSRSAHVARVVVRARAATRSPAHARVLAAAIAGARTSSTATGRPGLARGQLAVEVAEREFSAGSAHTAAVLMRSASVGSFAGAGSGVPTGTPVSTQPGTGPASPTSSATHAPSGSPVGSGSSAPGGSPAASASSVPVGSPAASTPQSGQGSGQAQSEFGSFEH